MIPFSKTTLAIEESNAVAACIKNGWVVLGPKSKEFEEKFAEYIGAKHAIFVDSCTSALFLGLKCLKHHLGLNKITVPSLTFTATAEAAINAGLDIKFGDVGPDFTLAEVHQGTLPVHLFGNKAKEGALIYDSAHRIERDDVRGSEALWCYSFYATKNMSTVQGGMIATNNTEYYEWLIKARDHGLNLGTKERYQGKYKQYDVEFVGWRLKGDDLRAVVGLEQLKKLPWMTSRRNDIVARYNANLGLKNVGNHVYPILLNNRDQVMDELVDEGIQTAIHYRPLHSMTGYTWWRQGAKLPQTEEIASKILSLPLFPTLTDEEVDYIISKVKKYV